MKVWILIFSLYVLYASVSRPSAFQDEKRRDPENKAGLCEKCQIFWKKLFISGGKKPFRK